jgi:hypothetical protein
MANKKYIFVIYSCKKYIDKSKMLYDILVNNLDNTNVYILYGDPDLEEPHKIIDNKYIVLKVNDDYDHLGDKTIALIKFINTVFPESRGLFKCDDDVVVNVKHINTFIHFARIKDLDYCGYKVVRTKEYNDWACQNNYDKYPVELCSYCGGPLYFLSKKALECFKTEPIKWIYYEDMRIGYHLNKNNIYPEENYNLYSNKILDSPKISYHNQKHFNELYVILQGGLGNQLFQIACGLHMAKKYRKKFVLNTSMIIPNPHQQHDANTTIDTLKKLFPQIPVVNTAVEEKDYFVFEEENNDCFLYTDKINECFNTYANIVLRGFFINNKYLPKADDFNKIISINPTDTKLLALNFQNIYFIHIRLGDYYNNKMYSINLTKYYIFCVERILAMNPNAIFYICTNQYDMVLQNIISNLPPQANYIIQDKTNDAVDTLYIMASCSGGICSNSTLSYMGAVLQRNKKKKKAIFMPYPFVNFINGFNDENMPLTIYPKWCSIYNTLTEKII